MSNNGTLGFDWDKLSAASTDLQTKLTEFNTAITAIFETVTNMGSSWTGPSYDAFLQYCTDYKKNVIDPLSTDVGTWVSNLSTLATSASETSSSNAKLFGGGQ